MIPHFSSGRSSASVPPPMAHFHPILGVLLALLIPTSLISAQTQEQLAQLEPSDLYYNGWQLARGAEKLIKEEKYVAAYAKLRQAKAMFDTMAINHATYRPDLVKMRQDSTRETMDLIYPKAEAEQKANQQKTENFIEGEGLGDPLIVPIDPAREQKRTRDLKTLQGQINQLKRSLAGAINDRDANAAKARKALFELEAERNRLASAPLKSELDAMNAEIAGLKRERDAMSIALSKTRSELGKTRQRLEIARQTLDASQKEVAELTAVIKQQGKINSRVVEGQQKQIDALRRQMKEKDQIIAESNRRLKQLSTQLEQSRAMVADLQDERETLIREKQEMSTLLELNEADRIQKLLSQNVSLNKQYRDAQKQLDAVIANDDASQEKLTLAKRGVTLAKAKIRESQKENARQKLRIRDLENRLEQAEKDLTMSAENGDLSQVQRAELTMLREIAKTKRDQLKAQQKKAELLVEQAQRMGLKDPQWAQAVNQFKGTVKPVLTAEEEAMIADVRADFTAISRFKPDSAERIRANRELQRRTGDLKKVASRLFAKDNLEASRGILEMVIEEDPSSWDAMINLGMVNLRLNDPTMAAKQFEQAIHFAFDRKIPLAHFLLGDAHYRNQRFSEATAEINLALSMDPDNAEAHVLLGNMAGKSGEMMDAEVHFKRAIEIDPNIWEPHYNLAFICSQNNRQIEGKIYYQEALRRGAPPNLGLEKKLEIK